MTTHAAPNIRRPQADLTATCLTNDWFWLTNGFALAFLIPFVLADWLDVNRDLYYGIYGALVVVFLGLWARATNLAITRQISRRPVTTLALTVAASAVLLAMVLRTEDATAHPDGIAFWAAVAWRGIFYGAVDGLLLSVFPIVAIFGALGGSRLRRRRSGALLVGAAALVASIAMTAVYHVGYSDFRGEKLRKPIVGDLVWSAPTLLTLNPVGAPLAHVSLHTAAVIHSYETDTFLPPHASK